jgi:hypothetical protein
MSSIPKFTGALLLAVAVTGVAQQAPERQMNVRQGPETVFDRPPADIVPLLAGAKVTGENGRVGSELVFWGFAQPDGRNVFMFACAPSLEVNCAERVALICPAGGTVLDERQNDGNIVKRDCRNVGVAAPGELRPGCEDREANEDLVVGVVSCN